MIGAVGNLSFVNEIDGNAVRAFCPGGEIGDLLGIPRLRWQIKNPHASLANAFIEAGKVKVNL
jgi:hypothetical protein